MPRGSVLRIKKESTMNSGHVHSPLKLPDSLQEQLLAFRRQLWTIKLKESFFGAVLGILLAFLATFVLDRLMDTPVELRFAIFIGAIVGCAMIPWALHRWVWRHR